LVAGTHILNFLFFEVAAVVSFVNDPFDENVNIDLLLRPLEHLGHQVWPGKITSML
jgi:hypothetical protein